MTTLLIDGDLLLYKAAFASQSTLYGVWPSESHYEDNITPMISYKYVREANNKAEDIGGFVSPIVTPKPEQQAQATFRSTVETVVDGVRDHVGDLADVIFAVSCPRENNFRHSLPSYLPYKGNRTSPAPYHLSMLREYAGDNYVILSGPELEADDCLGLHSTTYDICVLASIDKDLLTIPGRHYNWNTNSMIRVTPEQALHNFYAQLYEGDPADNVLGVPGIGPKKANAALYECKTEHSMHTVVYRGYKTYLTEKAEKGRGLVLQEELTRISNLAAKWLNQNANLLWIQREERKQWARDHHTFDL